MIIPVILLGLLLIICLYTDLKACTIPNQLSIGGTMVGLTYYSITHHFSGFIFSMSGAVVGFLMMLLLYFFGGIGAGDVKLFAAIGSIMGIEFVLYAAMYSILFAGLIGLLILIMSREGRARIRRIGNTLFGFFVYRKWSHLQGAASQHLTFPFMIAVVPGVLATLYYIEITM